MLIDNFRFPVELSTLRLRFNNNTVLNNFNNTTGRELLKRIGISLIGTIINYKFLHVSVYGGEINVNWKDLLS